jgi:hypothetical protein
MATAGHGIVPGGKVPIVNVTKLEDAKESKPATTKCLSCYIVMMRAGLPDDAVRHKMTVDGFNRVDIEDFLLSQQKNANYSSIISAVRGRKQNKTKQNTQNANNNS